MAIVKNAGAASPDACVKSDMLHDDRDVELYFWNHPLHLFIFLQYLTLKAGVLMLFKVVRFEFTESKSRNAFECLI